MASIIAAGFAYFGTAVLSRSKAQAGGEQAAPEITSQDAKIPDNLVRRRSAAANQFRDMLSELKDRVAQKAAARTKPAEPSVVMARFPEKAA